MTRKDYNALADLLRPHVWKYADNRFATCHVLYPVIRDLIGWLKADNPRFSEERFIDAISRPPEQ